MNLRTTGIIIRREYLNKVRKKSFLIITFLAPILFAGLCITPALIMTLAKEGNRKIAVIDHSGIVLPELNSLNGNEFSDYTDFELDSVKIHLEELGYDAVLSISPIDSITRSVNTELYSLQPLGFELVENIDSRINSAVEDYRVGTYGIDGLKDIMNDIKSNAETKTYTIDKSGKESLTETGVFSIVSMVLGIIIYMFITLFGSMVMSSVIEEKSSRVVEVLISTVKATELMFGKIIGIALVAVTQFVLWIVITSMIIGTVGAVAGPEFMGKTTQSTAMTMPSDVPAPQLNPSEGAMILQTLGNMPLAEILLSFLVFFIFGYMLYASMFAAVGSAVENEADTQQLQLPLTIPLLIGFLISIYTFKAPESTLALWGSMIPFTSPIVMLARIPFGVPSWQLFLSAGLLIVTFAVFAWASAKIYQVGILTFGKKSSWKDLWKWFRQK